ncbi:MAG: hypothetical protein II756_03115 [Clostridia bacterium]|nr:hypothetical protein [Clostridia bacterium]
MKRVLTVLLALNFALISAFAGCRPAPWPEAQVPADTGAAFTDEPATEQAASYAPAAEPTDAPASTAEPTDAPAPTAAPANTAKPTETLKPTDTPKPTAKPTNTPKPTAKPTDTPKPTAKPTNTPKPTAKPTNTPKPTAKPTNTPKPGSGDQSVFDDTAFMGSSVLHGMYAYGIMTHGTFLTKIGVNVNTVYTSKLPGSSVPIIDELNGKKYGKIIFNFGTNEAGWPSQSTFIRKYGDLIDDVHSRVPGAALYVLAITPVTKERSDGATDGINMTNINALNGKIKTMCSEKGVTFIKNPPKFTNSSGYLPDEASSDGIHLSPKYYRTWAAYLVEKFS